MKILIAITGASGAIYADLLLTHLKYATDHEVWVVASANGRRIMKEERGKKIEDFGLKVHAPNDFDVPYVSGSSRFDAMVVIPCSMGTMARIAQGISDDAVTRAADVFLKEKRKLIVVPRDTPFSLIHVENMRTLLLAGAHVIPAIPSFYSLPQTIDEAAATVTSRVLDHLGVENGMMKRWKEHS